MTDRVDDLADRLAAVRSGIADAAREAARDPAALTTVVVTKFQPATMVRELAALGVSDFGESRHQEARAKADELADLGLTWHFVGQLQAKKARQVARYARIVHSVDRDSLVDALAGAERPVEAFVEVNLTDDSERGGVPPEGMDALVERVLTAGGTRLLGVMAVAPQGGDPRRAFARLRELSDRIRSLAPGADRISAGMSGDYRAAIAEGATHLRIGAAITGERPPRG